MTVSFRDALLAALDRTGISLAKVAKGSGVSYEQLKKVKQRENAGTDVDDARKVANFFGYTLDEFTEDTTVEDRAALVATWNQLSPAEREMLRAVRQARLAPDPDRS